MHDKSFLKDNINVFYEILEVINDKLQSNYIYTLQRMYKLFIFIGYIGILSSITIGIISLFIKQNFPYYKKICKKSNIIIKIFFIPFSIFNIILGKIIFIIYLILYKTKLNKIDPILDNFKIKMLNYMEFCK